MQPPVPDQEQEEATPLIFAMPSALSDHSVMSPSYMPRKTTDSANHSPIDPLAAETAQPSADVINDFKRELDRCDGLGAVAT